MHSKICDLRHFCKSVFLVDGIEAEGCFEGLFVLFFGFLFFFLQSLGEQATCLLAHVARNATYNERSFEIVKIVGRWFLGTVARFLGR